MKVMRVRKSKVVGKREMAERLGWVREGSVGSALRGAYASNVSGGQEKRRAGHRTQSERNGGKGRQAEREDKRCLDGERH